MNYAETRQSADVIRLKKHSNTDSDVNSVLLKNTQETKQFDLDVVTFRS